MPALLSAPATVPAVDVPALRRVIDGADDQVNAAYGAAAALQAHLAEGTAPGPSVRRLRQIAESLADHACQITHLLDAATPMNTEHGNRIAAILSRHIGREEAITAPALCEELGWPASRERLVRQIIADESALWPVLVCGVPGAGFFVAQDIEEAAAYDNWLSDLCLRATVKVNTFRDSALKIGFKFPLPATPNPEPAHAA